MYGKSRHKKSRFLTTWFSTGGLQVPQYYAVDACIKIRKSSVNCSLRDVSAWVQILGRARETQHYCAVASWCTVCAVCMHWCHMLTEQMNGGWVVWRETTNTTCCTMHVTDCRSDCWAFSVRHRRTVQYSSTRLRGQHGQRYRHSAVRICIGYSSTTCGLVCQYVPVSTRFGSTDSLYSM